MSFCSRRDLASHQPAAGTGVRAEAYVFLPVAKRLWRAKEMNSDWASVEELAAIGAARRGGVVVRLYNPPRDEAAPAVLVHPAPERPAPPGLEPLLELFARRWPVDRERNRPRLAICTHGTRDRCCAKWGFAAFSGALRLFEQGRSRYQPLECSHLGGDRFAATGIFFPSGSMYAHLDSVDLEAVVAEETAGRIAPATYRGRVFEGPVAQLVRAGLAREGFYNDANSPLQVRRPHPDAEVDVETADGRRFQVSLFTADLHFYASCDKLADHHPASARRTLYAGARAVEGGGGAPDNGPGSTAD